MMELELQYVDPRLVALYDRDNPRGIDTEFYLQLATNFHAQRILDLGCGTGLLTCELAIDARFVVGVDPAPAMLACARRQTGAERVHWVEGDAAALGTPEADLVIMTGNVAQVFIDDDAWTATLRAIHAALRSGGYLAFESRTPDDRAWKHWNRADTYEQIESPNGPMECWLDLVSVEPGLVRFAGHNVFLDTGEVVVVASTLRFRTLAELTDTLSNAGFTIEHVYGDWHRGPVTSASRVMVVVARRD